MNRRIEFYRHDLGEVELASLRETLTSPFLTLGPRVGAFEKRLAADLGVAHAVGVSSCTLGLQLVLMALDIGAGDEVITTPMSWISTSNAALYVGATPVFVDIDPATGLIDPAMVARAITSRTRAILCVHLYGQMADVVALRALADQHGLALLEDAAHGFESERDGHRPGTLGDAAVFSFYATKTITSGDGGAIVTGRADLAERLRRLRSHGISKDAAARYGGVYQPWDMIELGVKGALTDVQAALLLPQLDRAALRRDAREAVVRRYEAQLADVAGIELTPQVGRSTHHLFTVRVDAAIRDRVIRYVGEAGVGVAINYPSIPTLTYYQKRFAIADETLPHASAFGRRTLSLPLWPGLPSGDIDYVCEQLIAAVRAAET